MQRIVGGDEMAFFQHLVAAAKVGDHAPRLAHQENTTCNIPRVEFAFPEPVITARRPSRPTRAPSS